ncbi:FAD-binding oxidoreductase [soil metagenome]
MELKTTLGVSRTVTEIYTPHSMTEFIERFGELRSEYSNLNAVSTGRNWGYGCNAPAESGGLLVELELCNKISNFEPLHGTVTLEPGVTFSQLADFLKSKGGEWMSPVHGGGPDCSVLGNALERGYGITPHSDHFGAVMALKAILPSGDIYEGTMTKIGLPRLDRLFKYGVGPYYDGLFSQSGLGVVTEVTIRLAKRPEFVEMFYFNVHDENDLEKIVAAVKKSKQELGSILGGINVMNRNRCLSMIIDYPPDLVEARLPISEEKMQQLSREYGLTPWLVVGMMYGPKSVVRAARKRLVQNFGGIEKRKFFYNHGNRKMFSVLGGLLSRFGFPKIKAAIGKVEMAFQLLNGVPSYETLRLAYWKNQNTELVRQPTLNPSRDGCGLIWYAPLVEMAPQTIRQFTKFVDEVSARFGFNSLITLTTVDDLCFDSTIPILFNRQDPKDVARATAFYDCLLGEGRKLGFFPYRLNIESQQKFDFQMDLFGLSTMTKGRYGAR